MPIVEEYLTADGRNHYRDWFMGLAAPAAAKTASAVARMAAGNTSNLKGISAGLAEWRIDWDPGLRIYVHQDGADLILLLAAATKAGRHRKARRRPRCSRNTSSARRPPGKCRQRTLDADAARQQASSP